MNMDKKAEQWFKRYTQECTLFLPIQNRKEHVKELNSDLLDKLEDLEAGEIDEEKMLEFLKQEGSPFCQARKYGMQRPLISQGLMPLFKLVYLVVLSVLTGVSFFSYFFQKDMGIAKHFSQYIGLVFSATGGMVLTFALMDRFAPQWKWDPEKDEWSPGELNPLQNQGLPSLVESIAGWFFGALFIFIFIALQDKIGLWFKEEGQWTFVPIFAFGFYKLIPFWIVGIGLESITQIIIRLQKGWTTLTRSLDLLRSGLDLALVFFIFKSGWDYLFLEGSLSGTFMEDLQNLTASAETLFPAILIIIMLAIIIGIVKKTIALLKAE